MNDAQAVAPHDSWSGLEHFNIVIEVSKVLPSGLDWLQRAIACSRVLSKSVPKPSVRMRGGSTGSR